MVITTANASEKPTTRGATLRLVRAAQHLDEIRRLIESYRREHPTPVRVLLPKEQLGANEYAPILDWGPAGTPPRLELAILVGEIAYNLRAALDYLVHRLAALDNAGHRLRYFPIEDDPTKWKKRRATWLKGIRDSHVDMIRHYQPFEGASWIQLLKTINNPDKHQALTLVVSQFSAPLSISEDRLHPIPGDEHHLEVVQPEQKVEFLLMDYLPLELSLHILLFEMAELVKDFRPVFGDRQTFDVNDPGAQISPSQQISSSEIH